MNPTAPAIAPTAAHPANRTADTVHRLVTGAAFASFVLVLTTLLPGFHPPGETGWPEAMLLVTATAATLISLSRRLPGQSVILAAAIIALGGGLAHAMGAAIAIPFGAFRFADDAGPRIFGAVAWPIPLIWVFAILNSRGVATLILQPGRNRPNYGLWLMGLTAVLTVMFDAALEPFATVVKGCWRWEPTRFSLPWHGAPLANAAGWLVTTLLILAIATPALIDKRQRPTDRPPDYPPLALWLLALSLFASGAIACRLWLPAGYCGVVGFAVVCLAIRGAKRRAQ